MKTETAFIAKKRRAVHLMVTLALPAGTTA